MTALGDFLLARIADDEAIAGDMRFQAAAGRPLLELHGGGTGIRRLTDPEHILAQCAAKRAIIEMFPTPPEGDGWSHAGWQVLEQLASVYADRPDYRPEWAL